MLQVRLFAAAREAIGGSEVQVAAGPVREVCAAIVASAADSRQAARTQAVLSASTLLCDGVRYRAADTAQLPDGATLDVLPPFAGG